jgi:ABC-type uncharacterized transport system substrate-binding protein
MISRRRFLATAGIAFFAATHAAQAQQPGKMPRIGTLITTRSGGGSEAFLKRMRELGWVDGHSIAIDRRFHEDGKPPSDNVVEFARLQVDAMFLAGPAALKAAASVTREIPIVAIDLESDPVEAGFAASLSRPGGNISGVFLDLPELIGKWFEWLGVIVPRLSRVAILWDPVTGHAQLNAAKAAARSLALQAHAVEVASAADLDPALSAVAQTRAGALILLSSPPLFLQIKRLVAFTLKNRLPAISLFSPFPEAGGLLSYGPDTTEMYARAANYMDKILRGVKAGELPIERPTRFALVVNLKTAKALGLTIPQSLLLRADQVIE